MVQPGKFGETFDPDKFGVKASAVVWNSSLCRVTIGGEIDAKCRNNGARQWMRVSCTGAARDDTSD